MPTTNTSQTLESGQTNGKAGELASALLQNGPTQVGGMVTSVILVGQAFAQFNDALAPYVAFLFSCFLATYQVWLVQKANVRQCLVIVPIAALILFALALGTNNSIAPTPESSSIKTELTSVKAELQLRDKELESAQQLIHELQQILGLPTAPVHSQEKTPGDPGPRFGALHLFRGLSGLSDVWIGEAQAQTPDDVETERQKALRALREYETRQQKLQKEQQKLEEKREPPPKEHEQRQQPAPLWRKW